MDRTESGRRTLILELDDAECQAALFGARVESVFADVEALAAQFPARTASVTRTLADWEAKTGRLKAEFASLGDTLGQTVVIAMSPAAEAMEGFIESAQRAAESFRSFVWSLLGGKADDAAESVGAVGTSAASTAKKVSGAASAVKRSLMAFDRINRLTASSSGSGGASGGSSGRTGQSAEDYIAASPFGEYLRALMDDDRYYDVGTALAAKLGEIVDGLDAGLNSESFRLRVSTALGRITDTVNGFLAGLTFEEADRQSVAGWFGDFVGDAIGLGLESIHTVLAGVRWDKLGTAAAQFVNGALASLKAQPVDFGAVAADWANALMGSLDGFLSKMDWKELGASVGRNVTSWFETVDWELAGRTLRDGIAGLKSTILAAFESMDIRWSDIISAFGRGLLQEDHPLLSRLLFGDGVTVPVKGVTDETPKKAKVLAGFSAKLAAWAESFAGTGAEKTIEFTAGITSWADGLKNKVVGAMTARLTGISDALTGEQRTIGATARFTQSADGLTEEKKTLLSNARFTQSADGLTEEQKTIGGMKGILTWWQRASGWEAAGYDWLTLSGWLDGWRRANGWSSAGYDLLSLSGLLTDWKRGSGWESNGWNLLSLTAYLPSWKRGSNWYSGGWDLLELTGYITSWKNGAAYTGTFMTRADGGVYSGGSWHPIAAYAGGGTPAGGQLFVAREAGPELVGTLGGHTAVMNNDQIVASVSAGVARAVAGIRFYSRDAATPRLAMLGESMSRSEEHLAAMARQAASEAAGGGTAQAVVLLQKILEALTSMDFDVKLDGASVKDRIVQLVNANTRATGVCEITI